MPLEEGAGGVGSVDLEALVLGAVAFDQPDVVEQRADVEQLRVVVQAELLALQRAPEEHPARVVEQQLRGDVLHELGGLAGERAVGKGIPAIVVRLERMSIHACARRRHLATPKAEHLISA